MQQNNYLLFVLLPKDAAYFYNLCLLSLTVNAHGKQYIELCEIRTDTLHAEISIESRWWG